MPDAELECDNGNGQVDTENSLHEVYLGTKQSHKWMVHFLL